MYQFSQVQGIPELQATAVRLKATPEEEDTGSEDIIDDDDDYISYSLVLLGCLRVTGLAKT